MTEGDLVVISNHEELGVFRFTCRGIMLDDDGKAQLVCFIEATENQELNGERLEEVCIKEELLQHHEG